MPALMRTRIIAWSFAGEILKASYVVVIEATSGPTVVVGMRVMADMKQSKAASRAKANSHLSQS